MNNKRLLTLCLIFMGIFLFMGCTQPKLKNDIINKKVQFLAIGDTPYNQQEQMQLQQSLLTKMDNSKYPFVTVYGDILSGSESCTDAMVLQRLGMYYMIKPNRVFYTPGDNEWTDCDREGKDFRYSELERLSFIRQFLQQLPLSPPKSWQYEQQTQLIENAKWFYEGVQFGTIHMVSTQNGRVEILKDDVEMAINEVNYRDEANIQWLHSIFLQAKKNNAKAVIIVSQADITKSKYEGECTEENTQLCDPFAKFTQALKHASSEFEKPVLFLHGDTNPYCFDKTFGEKIAPNLWRLNAWGDYQSHADATVVSFEPNNHTTPFSAHTLQSKETPQNQCKN